MSNYLRFLQDADTERQEDEARRYDATQDELDAREAGRLEGAPVAGEYEDDPEGEPLVFSTAFLAQLGQDIVDHSS